MCVLSVSATHAGDSAPHPHPSASHREAWTPTLTSDLGVAVSGCLGFQGDREGLSGSLSPPPCGESMCSKEAAQPQSTASQSPPTRPGAEAGVPGRYQRPPRPAWGPCLSASWGPQSLPSQHHCCHQRRDRAGGPSASPVPTAAQGQSPASGPLCRAPASSDRWVRRPGSRGGGIPVPWGGRCACSRGRALVPQCRDHGC